MGAVAVHQFRAQPEPTELARELFATYLAVEEGINSLFAKLGLAEMGAVHRRVAGMLLYLDERA